MFALFYTVGIEWFNNLNIENINDIIVYKALNEGEILEVALENEDQNVETDESEIQSPITAKLILDDLKIANKLAEHLLTCDNIM